MVAVHSFTNTKVALRCSEECASAGNVDHASLVNNLISVIPPFEDFTGIFAPQTLADRMLGHWLQ